MPPKKKVEPSMVQLNVRGHMVSVNSEMTEDQIQNSIGFALQCHDHFENIEKDFQTSNEQLDGENEALAQTNKQLTFNIEVQVMMLNEIKAEIGDEKYETIKKKVLSSAEFKKLKERSGT